MTQEQHEELRELTAFQHWLGTNYTTLATDSEEMTKRAILYRELHDIFLDEHLFI